jgi:hypothetical protein
MWKNDLKDKTELWLFREWIEWKFTEPEHRVTEVMQNADMWNHDRMHDVLSKVKQ